MKRLDYTSTRAELRRFWTRLLNDLEAKRYVSDERAETGGHLALSWST